MTNLFKITGTLIAAQLCATSIMPFCHAETFYSPGVTANSGWYDTNKTWNGDTLLCWAAASANILQWMQDQAGYVPAGTPNGTDSDGQLKIFKTFVDNWKNASGNAIYGVSWFLYGNDSVAASIKQYQKESANTTGGYWGPSYFDSDTGVFGLYLPTTKNQNFSVYAPSDGSGSFYYQFENLTINSYQEMLQIGLDESPLSLSLLNPNNPDTGHAVTAWGYETDADGNVVGLYISDSDDSNTISAIYYHEIFLNTGDEADPNDDILEISTPESTLAAGTLVNNFTGWKIADALGLFIPIPEPSLFSFFAGMLALIIVVTKRSRRKS